MCECDMALNILHMHIYMYMYLEVGYVFEYKWVVDSYLAPYPLVHSSNVGLIDYNDYGLNNNQFLSK